MRLTRIEAHELFSFDTLTIDDLPKRAAVVGPNSAGKTNLLRVVEIARVAVERSATSSPDAYSLLVRFAAGRRFEAPAVAASTVRLGIAATEEWEVDQFTRFIRAAIFTSILEGAPTNLETGSLEAWVDDIHSDELAPLTYGDIVVELTDPTAGHWDLAYEFSVDGERFRWILDGTTSRGAILHASDSTRSVATYPFSRGLDLDTERVPTKPFEFADLLPPRGEALQLSVEAVSQPVKEPVRAWARNAGVSVDEAQRRGYSFSWALRPLFERGLVLLGDLRQPPQVEYPVEGVDFDPSPADAARVPLRLFRLKNGDPDGRRRFKVTQELFTQLTGRGFDIVLAPMRTSPPTTIGISPVIDRDGHDLPVEFAGAGLWEALLLSAALADSVGRVAILDEPARNLHPNLQRRFLEELNSAEGQFVVITHSPYLVPVGDEPDATTIRLGLAGRSTRAHRYSDAGGPSHARLRKILRESADARSLPFAAGVLLVEGGTELGALPVWFAKSVTAKRRGTPESLNLVTFSVDGDSNFGTVVHYLHALGVPWAIVCDADILRFDTRKTQILQQLVDANAGATELQNLASRPLQTVFAEVREIAALYGVFTLADDWIASAEGFEAYVEKVAPGQLHVARSTVGTSKPRQGRHVAETNDCPDEVADLYARVLDFLGLP